ncbi:CD225/dispanin family protein [Amycolatopsis sp., V23-08]|uniref:CD225/dispanin family protein n=1 Tax=Amycolatopsis heterodermiae TaxID=3110235 RepID=A0ABU5RJS5_9PSEU|nr:CD225/dispanin family protein [Amycolatopsis sp., V23-08]MEA5366547.1 CD225/dispanin family protein [Amycolatopsis sp., V23-08]
MTNPYGQQQPPYGQQPQSGGFPQQPGYGPPSGGMPAYGQPAPYGQPPTGGFGAPGYGMPGGDINGIKDYKGWAIASLFLGGLILGIFAIMKSNEVGTYKMQGNYMMAEQASRTTKTLCLISTILGGIGCVTAIILIIVAATATTVSRCYGYYC